MFLANSKGTPINPWLGPLTLNILERPRKTPVKNEWQTLIEKDKTPPEPFKITLGKNPSVFNNQYFISFFAADKESGVAYYEVKEGKGGFVKVRSPYLLKDQSLRSKILVKAIDEAGNERVEELSPSAVPFYKNILFWVVVFIIIAIILLYVSWIKFRAIVKKDSEN